jgi:hypothetical protein
VIVKVRTLDDPSLFGIPQMAIYTLANQAFHQIPDGLQRLKDCQKGSAHAEIPRRCRW